MRLAVPTWAVPALLSSMAAPSIALAQADGATPSLSLARVVGSLLLCLVLAAAAVFVLRARGGGLTLPQFQAPRAKPRRLEVLDRVRINPQTDVCLLRCDQRTILVSAGPNGCSVICGDIDTLGDRT